MPDQRIPLLDPTMLFRLVINDDSVGMEFMTDDASEANEMREQMLALIVQPRTRRIGSACVMSEVQLH
jgi:hypothetical protein